MTTLTVEKSLRELAQEIAQALGSDWKVSTSLMRKMRKTANLGAAGLHASWCPARNTIAMQYYSLLLNVSIHFFEEDILKKLSFVVFIRFVLASVVAMLLSCTSFAQTQTDTTCTSTDVGVNVKTNCTSETKEKPRPLAALDRRGPVDWDKIRAGNIARADARRAQKQEVIDIVYCRQNPSGSITSPEKTEVSCADVISHAAAKCIAEPKSKTCKNLAAIDKRNKQK